MAERNSQGIHDETEAAADAPDHGLGGAGCAAGAASRAFVVELASGAEATGTFSGRVRHLTTFDGGNFSSAESLVSIIRRVLGRAQRNQIEK